MVGCSSAPDHDTKTADDYARGACSLVDSARANPPDTGPLVDGYLLKPKSEILRLLADAITQAEHAQRRDPAWKDLLSAITRWRELLDRLIDNVNLIEDDNPANRALVQQSIGSDSEVTAQCETVRHRPVSLRS